MPRVTILCARENQQQTRPALAARVFSLLQRRGAGGGDETNRLGCPEHAKVWSSQRRRQGAGVSHDSPARPLAPAWLRYVPFPLETVSTNIAARGAALARLREMAPLARQSRAANWTKLDGPAQEMARRSLELVAKNWLVAAKRS